METHCSTNTLKTRGDEDGEMFGTHLARLCNTLQRSGENREIWALCCEPHGKVLFVLGFLRTLKDFTVCSSTGDPKVLWTD